MFTKQTEKVSYRISRLAKWFASHANFDSFSLGGDEIILAAKQSAPKRIPFLTIGPGIALERGYFWDVLAIHLEDGYVLRIGGVAKKQSERLLLALNHHSRGYIRSFYQRIQPDILQAHEQARLLFSGQGYIRYPVIQQWLTAHRHLAEGVNRQDTHNFLHADALSCLPTISPLLKQGYDYISELNDAYMQRQLAVFQSFFDQVESNPLTDKQRKACVIDEQYNLVLAGAGTGKTSTMIGRAGYLIKAGLCRPEEILMLAFARKAAEEMDERIREKLNIDQLTVKTFHSLGTQIIAEVEGVAPSINKMADDKHLRANFVDRQIQRLLHDAAYKSRLVSYFVNFSFPYKSAFKFKSLGEYNKYISENDIRTLQGDLVKSYEECEIANFLFRQGLVYEYEANYQVDTKGPDYRPYQPDFYLPEQGIYIEHFAVNENNQTPPFINQKSYLEGMRWKRALHKKHQTHLIETYSYQKRQGILTQSLHNQLQQAGVQYKPLANDELLDHLNEFGRVSEFSRLLAEVLVLFKAAYRNMKSLLALANQHEDSERMHAAALLFEPIFAAYQQDLRDTQTIDFEDMIGRAIEYVENGCYQAPYRYILVDEFQDISAGRARLIKALHAQNKQNSLFCVGDDWQAIYRFTGSDVSITKDFETYFGYAATSVLDKTFRFNNKIGALASRFVMQNSSQIVKEIQSQHITQQAAVSLIKTDQDQVGLHAALAAINDKAQAHASVLILARFKYREPEMSMLKREFPKLTIQFMTVHAAKGQEADYVIVLGMEKGKNGFPSEKMTHAFLALLQPETESFAHAEDRRLFYVALTRARRHVYLVCDANKVSDFIRELIADNYEILSDTFTGKGFQEKIADIVCGHCKTGYLVPRDSQYGSFFGCSEHPLCSHTQAACQRCGGGLKENGRFRVCENQRCEYVEPICPMCGGTMKFTKGPYGEFWGCSHYRKNAEFSCTHTEKNIDTTAAKRKCLPDEMYIT